MSPNFERRRNGLREEPLEELPEAPAEDHEEIHEGARDDSGTAQPYKYPGHLSDTSRAGSDDEACASEDELDEEPGEGPDEELGEDFDEGPDEGPDEEPDESSSATAARASGVSFGVERNSYSLGKVPAVPGNWRAVSRPLLSRAMRTKIRPTDIMSEAAAERSTGEASGRAAANSWRLGVTKCCSTARAIGSSFTWPFIGPFIDPRG